MFHIKILMSGLTENSWMHSQICFTHSINCQSSDVTTRHIASGKLLVHMREVSEKDSVTRKIALTCRPFERGHI